MTPKWKYGAELRNIWVWKCLKHLKSLNITLQRISNPFRIGMLLRFGIAFTSSVVNFLDTLERRQDPAYSSLLKYFGSLDVSILTLYMSMTGGQNWGVFYEALTTVPGGEVSCILYILYVTFAPGQQRCFGAGVLSVLRSFWGRTSGLPSRCCRLSLLWSILWLVSSILCSKGGWFVQDWFVYLVLSFGQNEIIWLDLSFCIKWSGYHQQGKPFRFGFWQTSSKHLVLLQGCTAQRCKISDDHDTVTSRVVQHWRLSLRIAFCLAAFRSSQPRLTQHCNPARMTVRLLSRSCSIFVQLDRHL